MSAISLHYGQIPTDPHTRFLAVLALIVTASRLTPEQAQTVLSVLELIGWLRK